MKVSNLFAVLVLVLLMQSTTPVLATSVARVAPHNPAEACDRANQLVENMADGKPWGPTKSEVIFFYSDRYGEVERHEREEFARSMLHSNGKRDKRRMKVASMHRLSEDERWPQYVLSIDRSIWKMTRWETDDMQMEREIEDPHWTTEYSSWLVQFRNNSIHSVRQAGELAFLVSDLERLKGC